MKTETLILALLVAVAPVCSHADSIYFQPTDWKFGTVFPGMPDVSNSIEQTPNGEVVSTRMVYKTSPEVFEFDRGVFPSSMPANLIDAAYDGAMNAMLAKMNGLSLTNEKTNVLGHDARHCTWIAELHGEIYFCDVRMIIVKNEAYLLMYERPKNAPDSQMGVDFKEGLSDSGWDFHASGSKPIKVSHSDSDVPLATISDTPPVPTFQSRPYYPYALRKLGVEGNVVVSFVVDDTGIVVESHAVSATNEELGWAATACVSKWKFDPATHEGHPVFAKMQVPIIFALNPK